MKINMYAPPPPKHSAWRLAFIVQTIVFVLLILGAGLWYSAHSASQAIPPQTTAQPTINLPTAISIVTAYQPPEYFVVTWKANEDPAMFHASVQPLSYAEFTVCEGAGGSGCTSVSYALAIYATASRANTTTTTQFTWEQPLGNCLILSDDTTHGAFLESVGSFQSLYPC